MCITKKRAEEITFQDRRHSWPVTALPAPLCHVHTRAEKSLGLSPEVPSLLQRKPGGNCWAHPEGVSPPQSTANPHQCPEIRQCLGLSCFSSKHFIWLKTCKAFPALQIHGGTGSGLGVGNRESKSHVPRRKTWNNFHAQARQGRTHVK